MSAPAVTWRDAGQHVAALRWLDRGGGLLRRLGWAGPGFEPDAIERAARKQTGLEDLGEPTYREPLEVLCEALAHEADLTSFGRLVTRAQLVSALSSRMRLLDHAKRNPEVREERIEKPWIILGLPRTGTTLLSFLLGQDPLARPLRHWEAGTPVPPPELATQDEDPRIATSTKQIDGLMRMNPAIRAMHPMSATLPTECVVLLFFDLRALSIETQALIPSYGRWLEATDMRSAYRMHRLALQTLQSRVPTAHWSLKTPNHLWCLEALLEHYPDARLIWTHRDPAKVVPSVVSLNAAMQRPFCRKTSPHAVAEEWNHKLHGGVERGMHFDERAADPDWCHHLHYAELMRDPVGSVERLYQHFGAEVSPLHRRRMQAWMRDRPQETFGRHVYDPRDFGLDASGLRERYADYIRRYDIPPEG